MTTLFVTLATIYDYLTSIGTIRCNFQHVLYFDGFGGFSGQCTSGHFFVYLIECIILGWHWLMKWYRFQGYTSMVPHLVTVLCVHHQKSSLFPSPIIPFTLFCLPLPLPSGPHHTGACVWGFFYATFIWLRPKVTTVQKAVVHLHNGILSAIIKKEILHCATVWMDLESVMSSEISQSEKDNYHMTSVTCGS